MPPTDAEFARRILQDATSTSITRGSPARRAFARKVINNVFDRAAVEDPERLRLMTQEVIHGVHRDALNGNAEAAVVYREAAAAFRADGFDVPPLPGDDA